MADRVKGGARHSVEDMNRLDKIHSLLKELGYDCAGTESAPDTQKSRKAAVAPDRRLAVQIKAKTADTITVAGWGVVFGGYDLYGDTFVPDTNFMLDYVPRKNVYWDHTLSGVKHAIGAVTSAEVKSIEDGNGTISGLWIEAQLDRSKAYVEEIAQLVEMGVLGWSSGAIGHLVEYAANSWSTFKQWPIVEWSLTPEPAEPRTLGAEVLKGLGLDPQAVSKGALHGAQGNAAVPAVNLSITVNTETKSKDKEEITTMGEDEKEIQAPATPAVQAPAAPVQADGNGNADAGIMRMSDAQFKAFLKSSIGEILRETYENAEPVRSAGFYAPAVVKARGDREKDADPETAAIKAFERYIRTGYKAAMNEGTDAQGGYYVPTKYDSNIVAALTEESIMRQAGARIIPVTGTDSFRVPSLSWTGRAVKTAEGAAFDEAEPTAGEIEFNPYKYTRLSKVTEELLADSRFDVFNQILVPDVAQAFAAAENADFTTGTGTAEPQGIVTGATVAVTAASSSTVTYDELLDLYYSLNHLYRQRAKFMMSDSMRKVVAKIVDSNGDHIFQAPQAGAPATLFGAPVIINNSMAGPGVNAKTILWGDFSYFWVADFGTTGTQRLNELYAANGYIGFRWFRRYDSNVMLAAAIQALQMAAV